MTAPRQEYAGMEWFHVRDERGVVHLADESVFGGLAISCDDWGVFRTTVVVPVPNGQVCAECRAAEDGPLNLPPTPREDTPS